MPSTATGGVLIAWPLGVVKFGAHTPDWSAGESQQWAAAG